ncbi:MAG: photosystem II stability/assembly factor-like protein, partial [Azonexus sp.]|nr:photosystem II stability/assembly factor-like protein [Azonexus sp.]
DAEPHLYAAQLDAEGVVTIAGEFELIARSTDGGNHWTVLHQGARSLFGLAAGPNGRLFAVGQEGVILKSGDNGKSWSTPPSGTSAILTGVWAGADGQAVVAVGVRAILISRDGGSSFAPAPAFASTAAGNVYSTAQGAGQPGAQQAVSIGGARGEILRLNF